MHPQQQTIDPFRPHDDAPAAGSRKYWAPCLAVALVAMSLYYVTLKDLMRENAARAPASAAAVAAATMPVYTEPAVLAREAPARQRPVRTPVADAQVVNASAEAPASAPAQPRAFVEVHKCVMPEGDAIYSDGPCPQGAQVSTLLRLPRNLQASTRL